MRVVAGYQKTCAWKKDGSLWCFGDLLTDVPSQPRALSSPLRVSELKGQAVALAAGDSFTCALTLKGSVWCWGNGTEGQLGTGRKRSSASPVRVRLPCPG
ncbi:RCC1 domain-containing protein [Stigmatella aurantiaca]|uniref:RCC1 domain-containing protein n=1 Tax=Stigmatella aurantiaca TaxID=41 RepID=UPI0012FA8963|nr:RCC1 domain-containing protein [Stigmatella aurantiaca]